MIFLDGLRGSEAVVLRVVEVLEGRRGIEEGERGRVRLRHVRLLRVAVVVVVG